MVNGEGLGGVLGTAMQNVQNQVNTVRSNFQATKTQLMGTRGATGDGILSKVQERVQSVTGQFGQGRGVLGQGMMGQEGGVVSRVKAAIPQGGILSRMMPGTATEGTDAGENGAAQAAFVPNVPLTEQFEKNFPASRGARTPLKSVSGFDFN